MTGPAQGSREISHFCPQASGQRTNTGSLPSAGPCGPAVCLGRKRTWSDGLSILAAGNLICAVSPPSCGSLQIPSPGAATQDQTWPARPRRTSGGTMHGLGVFVHRVWVEFLLVTGTGLLHQTPLPCWGHRGPRWPASPELSTQTSTNPPPYKTGNRSPARGRSHAG